MVLIMKKQQGGKKKDSGNCSTHLANPTPYQFFSDSHCFIYYTAEWYGDFPIF